jgi:glyoxylase-like metal-dependent hydrolase (beta-lactamase superfamily II)
MTKVSRFTIATGLLVLAVAVPCSLFGQNAIQAPTDLSGEWRRLTSHEDAHERGGGPDPGEYWGLPLNDAARMRADTYNGNWLSTSLELQCRPHPTGYQQLGPDQLRIEKHMDPVNRQITAYEFLFQRTPGNRMVWLDGRPHPSQYATHSWEGFSTGKWEGDVLTVESTHLKESFIRRNGVEGSFRRTVTEHIALDEPYLSWIIIVNDPDYLTEPLVRSVTFQRAPNAQLPVYPCAPQPEEYRADVPKDHVPNWFVGINPYLTEVAFKYKVPLEGVRGGAETLYPEYQAKAKALSAPTAQSILKPEYKDASTRIAEMADAQPPRPPRYDQVETLHVNRNVFMIGGAGGNIALSAGADGVLMVNSGASAASEQVLAAIKRLPVVPPSIRNSASTFADTWQSEHSQAPTAVRMIINTSMDPDYTGGNASIATSDIFHPIGTGTDQSASEVIIAHENVLKRMEALKDAPEKGLPTNTYFGERYRLHRFMNGEGIEVISVPNAHTDGDSIVWFRGSDVISTGEIFNSESYPNIDVDRGGSIQGVIDALIRVGEMCYPEYMSQGGTLVIPGRGHISDVAEVGYYRDMMIILRDRVQDMIKRGMTLQQVKAAKPTVDYDPLFGREPGVTSKFVEAVYRSLTDKKPEKAPTQAKTN